mmetsp:Transcript_154693/g.495950  ORF Transcript_154693/g.495950 Transcript_154693/m.495950 type:complete len:82 (+) Transcript_154693:34-279(+)
MRCTVCMRRVEDQTSREGRQRRDEVCEDIEKYAEMSHKMKFDRVACSDERRRRRQRAAGGSPGGNRTCLGQLRAAERSRAD